jgi:hypothetical protein
MKLINGLLLITSLLFSCKKNVSNSEIKSGPSDQCSGPIRYRNMIFLESQIQFTGNVVYRDSVSGYATSDTIKRTLTYDFFSPRETDTSILRPLIILLPGGGFTGLTDMTIQAKRFAMYGYCVAAVRYRTDPSLRDSTRGASNPNLIYSAIYRATQDVRLAIRIAKSAHSFSKIDTNYVFAGGVSAGAITAYHVAYMSQDQVPPSVINENIYGPLDYGGYTGFSSKLTGIFAHAGMITNMNFIDAGEAPAFNMMSRKDNYYPIGIGRDSLYKAIATYGAEAVSQRQSSVGISNKLILYDDLNITVGTGSLSDPIHKPFSHGSIFSSSQYQARDVDSTASWLYKTFASNPCAN